MDNVTIVITLTPLGDDRWKSSLDDPYDWFGTPIAEAEGGSKDAAVQNLLKGVTFDD